MKPAVQTHEKKKGFNGSIELKIKVLVSVLSGKDNDMTKVHLAKQHGLNEEKINQNMFNFFFKSISVLSHRLCFFCHRFLLVLK